MFQREKEVVLKEEGLGDCSLGYLLLDSCIVHDRTINLIRKPVLSFSRGNPPFCP
jgi:hypothetical protein